MTQATQNHHLSFLNTRRHFLASAGALLTISLAAKIALASKMPIAENEDFSRWLIQFSKKARAAGITQKTLNQAFANIQSPNVLVLQKASVQPEFTGPAWRYFDVRINDYATAKGQELSQIWDPWLKKIEQKFSVDRHILLAIWSMETSYGEAMKRHDIMIDTISALATLAYADPKRRNFGQTQLLAALKILQNGAIDRSHLTGSWAGAMGHTQFIPTTYLAYGVDMDGDGRCNIWSSIPDALASSANLLKQNRWQSGHPWFYEIISQGQLPAQGTTKNLREWQELGFQPADSEHFAFPEDAATLLIPDGAEGPLFLVCNNFYSLKRYNNSDRYALAVGILANKIAGKQGIVRDWQRPLTSLSKEEKKELQSRLAQAGYY